MYFTKKFLPYSPESWNAFSAMFSQRVGIRMVKNLPYVSRPIKIFIRIYKSRETEALIYTETVLNECYISVAKRPRSNGSSAKRGRVNKIYISYTEYRVKDVLEARLRIPLRERFVAVHLAKKPFSVCDAKVAKLAFRFLQTCSGAKTLDVVA